jgi:SAM-dependent methyltransferase
MNESSNSVATTLAESAPLAHRLAAAHCGSRQNGTENCAWMHGAWQYLRLLGLVGSIERRAAFYQTAFARLATHGIPLRVLLSGAADYAMLDIVAAALRQHQITATVTVLDTCATPLLLNQWYAGRISFEIKTVCSDILLFDANGAFDVICTDSFLGRFAPTERPRLIDTWHRLLAPGGCVLTDNRLREASAPDCVGFSTAEAAAFGAAAHAAALNAQASVDLSPDECADLAIGYAKKHTTWSVRSLQELNSLFERGGFSIESQNVTATTSGAAPMATAPSTPQRGAPFAGTVARKH